MVVRTQITLDAELHNSAKRRAAERGISFAEYIRRTVKRDLGEQPRGDIGTIFGIGDSGGSHVARHKDDYLGEAVAAGRARKSVRRPGRVLEDR